MSSLAGEQISLLDMLAAREKRSSYQKALLKKYPSSTLLSVTMNIPGPVKNNNLIASCFERMIVKIKAEFGTDQGVCFSVPNKKTGPEYLQVISLPAFEVKQKMIQLEEKTSYGRLFDLDVLYSEKEVVKSISRQELSQAPRRCFICDKDAKVCGRQQTHSPIVLQEKIVSLLQKGIQV